MTAALPIPTPPEVRQIGDCTMICGDMREVLPTLNLSAVRARANAGHLAVGVR